MLEGQFETHIDINAVAFMNQAAPEKGKTTCDHILNISTTVSPTFRNHD
jgi:hypothetical protein